MKATIRFVLLTAFRDRLFSSVLGLLAVAFSMSLFLGSTALIEQGETGLIYAAGICRFVLVLGLVVFVAFQTQRLYDSREIEAMLSRSISRTNFTISYWVGFAVVALALVLPVAILIFYFYGIKEATLAWALSLLLECWIVLAFAQFTALTLERATTTIFVTLAFYGFARLIGFFLGIRETMPPIGINRFINPMIDGLGLVLPRLDLLAQTEWLVYGFSPGQPVYLILLQAVVFVTLILAASAYDLRQKQF